MTHVVIIGCGVVGAAIAYELSKVNRLKITVVDQQPPALASTGAALGVLMGIISQKTKGKAWQMRRTSILAYETLISELEALTNRKIHFNRQGILMLLPEPSMSCLEKEDEEISRWEKLQEIRQSQGFSLEIWDTDKLKQVCPQVNHERMVGAVYSACDRQVDPTSLTLALVDAAKHNGVDFKFGVQVLAIEPQPLSPSQERGSEKYCNQLQTTDGKITADWFVVAAGLGSSLLSAQLEQMVDIRPVLGQALCLRLGYSLGNCDFQPVITGDDVHIVPIGGGDYWIGATVEFASNKDEIIADKELLELVRQQAIAFCPGLATATTIRTWSGLRPRPEGRPAPVIGKLPGYNNILLATGHYRNGVLLAPATAYAIREMIIPN
ncbi:FAD-dependent oxidoreductase [Brasilonema octagenarum UFV-E1]|uniref:FAD-dependent oxidoreductase n=1 Tax=Brasilonema sennae CENA114 TaxID=415709 RepID=A0A856M996_9CYAN|nr:FAD-dependent oxidoreductase [Brasilonema sennae]QDL06954.1 FAD-dependent oxidoreductase [Brasilonema sennae CENA114]QDL13317.1 FAD-dependent oxidoreductase [Brasilonema octagenarum UFV-E1]